MSHPAFTDTVTRVRGELDEWGEVDIDRVKPLVCRVVPTSKTLIDGDGKTLQLTYRVVFPGDADVLISDKLKIDDRELTIKSMQDSGTIGLAVTRVVYV